MTEHDMDLYAPVDDAGAEPERVCVTCRHFDPCPRAVCDKGVCRMPFVSYVWTDEAATCNEWEEA